MQKRKSSNTHIHVIRDGYSPKADGPKNPPKGGSAVSQWSTRSPGSTLREAANSKNK